MSETLAASLPKPGKREELHRQRVRLQSEHHARCMFNGNPITRGLAFEFRDNGQLTSVFQLGQEHMGYDGMAHGGVIAAIVDAAMAQCLMGHGVVGYTTDLHVRYRKPLRISSAARLLTVITAVEIGVLYTLVTDIRQGHHLAVQATGRFCSKDAFTH